MKRSLIGGMLVFIVMLVSLPALPAETTVEAYLDPTCTTIGGAFTIPSGTKAVRFSATMSSPWRACSVDSPIESIGFMIVDSEKKTLYMYVQHKDGSTQEPDGSLGALSLPPGSYNVYVQGGLDTRARLSFETLTEKVIFTP
jgi:hypothetical protein